MDYTRLAEERKMMHMVTGCRRHEQINDGDEDDIVFSCMGENMQLKTSERYNFYHIILYVSIASSSISF